VCGEGANGVKKRLDAWKHSRFGDTSDSFITIPHAVQFRDRGRIDELAAIVAEDGIGFVAFDTLNRCATGLEENSATDMGIVLDAMSYVRDANPGTSVAVVHHSGKDGTKERGSSALFDGMDTVYFSNGGHGEPVEMERRKRKDGEEVDRHTFRLRLVAGTESGVLDPIDPLAGFPSRNLAETIIRHFIAAFYPLGGASRTSIKEALPDSITRQAFHKAIGQLVETGRLTNSGTAKQPFYRLGRPLPGDFWTADGRLLPRLDVDQ
jgi:hypothetical protein